MQALAWLPDDSSLAAMDCHGNLALFSMNGCLQTLNIATTSTAPQPKVYTTPVLCCHMHVACSPPCANLRARIAYRFAYRFAC